MIKKEFSIILLLLTLFNYAKAQNLEEISLKKGINANGSISFSSINYFSNGIASRRDPFNWFLSGNLNLDFFGYNAPFFFSYSNSQKNFSQPFNQFSFAPQYKWAKAYIGYNSMTFSNYTLAGHIFLGGGVELTPGKWRFAAMYGRLKKAVPYDFSDSLVNTYGTSYRRMGMGMKAGFDDGNGNTISINIFQAKDDEKSLTFLPPSTNITPKENIVWAISGRKRLLGRMFIESEYAYSIINNNTSNIKLDTSLFINEPGLEKPIRNFDAYNAGLGYQGNWYMVVLRYERISPDYQTLGAYYFNNDMRNITIVPSVRLLKSKLNLSGNVGFQRNNLDETKTSTTERFVGSMNASYVPNEHWNFSGNYSNFSTYTNERPLNDPFFKNNLDTLNFYQVNSTLGGMTGYTFGTKERKQNVMLNLSYQKANDRASYIEGGSKTSDYYNSYVSYNYSITPQSITLSSTFNYYTNNSEMRTTYWGPGINITKGFMEKRLNTTVSTTFNKSSTASTYNSSLLNSRFSLNYSPKPKGDSKQGKHNLSGSANILNKFKGETSETGERAKGFSEFTVNFAYVYSF